MPFPAIWINGRIAPLADARISIFDHGLLYGDGVFEGIRFYERRPFRLDAHLARLERSARAIELVLPYGRAALVQATQALIEHTEAPDGYIRLIVTRGEGDLGLDPRSCQTPNTILAAAPLRAFASASTAGLAVLVVSTRQAPADVLDPRIKSLNYMNRLLARLEAIRGGADEAIVLNARGHIAEGSTDNIFLVREGRLLTPPAADGALEGITREVVLQLADELKIPTSVESIGSFDLRVCSEAFLVGTAAGVLAIRTVDGRLLPSCPGDVFRRIAPAFEALVRTER